MSLPQRRLKASKINFFIRKPFPKDFLLWVKEEDKIAKNIDVTYINDLAISLSMAHRFKEPTILILDNFGLKLREDYIII